MNILQFIIPVTLITLSTEAEPWLESLSRMRLDPAATITRTNCIQTVLEAFQPDDRLKAIIFLPGVANRFYLLERNAKPWTIQAGDLREALVALTNVTPVHATFAPPFLLLHTARDSPKPRFVIKSETKAERLHASLHPARLYVDRHWSSIQTELQKALKTRLRPSKSSEDAWHFARHNLAFNHLSDWEALLALSLAGDNSFTIRRCSIRFERSPTPPQ